MINSKKTSKSHFLFLVYLLIVVFSLVVTYSYIINNSTETKVVDKHAIKTCKDNNCVYKISSIEKEYLINKESLKDEGIFSITQIENDANYTLNIIDFNLTSITINISAYNDKKNKNVPLKIFEKNASSLNDYKNFKTKYKLKNEYKYDFNNYLDNKIITLPYNIGEVIEFGENSTIYVISENITSGLQGCEIHSTGSVTCANRDGLFLDGNNNHGFQTVLRFAFNLSSIPSTDTINSVNLGLAIGYYSGPPWVFTNLTASVVDANATMIYSDYFSRTVYNSTTSWNNKSGQNNITLNSLGIAYLQTSLGTNNIIYLGLINNTNDGAVFFMDNMTYSPTLYINTTPAATSYILVNFTNPTLPNNTNTNATSIIINSSIFISNSSLNNLIYNWNGVNYTRYDSSLVLMYNFENLSALGESDTKVVGVSLYSNNGTPNSNATWTPSGKYGGAYNFSGDGSWINTNYLPTNGSKTISAWINQRSIRSGLSSYFLSNYNANGGSSGNKGFGLRTNGNNIICNIANSSGAGIAAQTGTVFTAGTWTHVVCNYNNSNGNLSIFVNGAFSPTASVVVTGGDRIDNGNYTIGRLSTGNTNNAFMFNGTIDEVRIWNRSLGDNEVYQLYASNLWKLNSTQWYLYVNQSQNSTNVLADGTYNYQIHAYDNLNNYNKTEIRYVTVQANPPISVFNCSVINTNGSYILNNSISNSISSTCINITANNVKFDCNGYSIDGIYSGNSYGIYNRGNNISIQNCVMSDWYYDIFLNNNINSSITNVTTNSSFYSVYLFSSLFSQISNSTFKSTSGVTISNSNNSIIQNINSSYNTISLKIIHTYNSNQAGYCNHQITNWNGTNNKPILLLNNSQYNITSYNNNFSEIVLCNAPNSNLSYINISGSGYSTNLFIYKSDNTSISNSNFNYSSTAIHSFVSNGLKINNNVFTNNTVKAIFLEQSDKNNISNSNFTNNYMALAVQVNSDNSTINSNYFKNNIFGVYMDGVNFDNLIYNNFFNNTYNLNYGLNYRNKLNITKTSAINIVNGSSIGGNFWATPMGTGFSQTCADLNVDSICDGPYAITSNNIDYLPLVKYIFGDSIPPNLTITSPSNNTFVNGNVTITATSWDANGIKNLTFIYSNSTSSGVLCVDTTSPYSCLWQTTLFSNSTLGYNIQVISYDNNNNLKSITNKYVIDRTKPLIKDIKTVYPGNQSSIKNNSRVVLRINVTDSPFVASGINRVEVDLTNITGQGNVTMTLEGGSLASGSWSQWKVNVSVNSVTDLQLARIYVYDNANPVSNLRDSDVFSVQVDNQIPTYNNLYHTPDSPYNMSTVFFSLDVNDNYMFKRYIFSSNLTGVWVNSSINASSFESESITVGKKVNSGSFQYKFYIFDDAGNMNETGFGNITVAGNSPGFNVYLVSPIDSYNSSANNPSLKYFYENGAAINCSLYIDEVLNNTNTTVVNNTLVTITNSYSDKSYTWYASCINSETLEEIQSETRNFIIDTLFPHISIVYPTNITYSDYVTQINYTSYDSSPSSCWYSLDNGVNNDSINCGENITSISSSVGSNTWKVWIKDSVDNINSSSITFSLDNIAPSLIIISPNKTTYSYTNILINISASNYSNIWYSYNNTNTTYINETYINFPSEKTYTLIAWANDSMNNINTTSHTFSIYLGTGGSETGSSSNYPIIKKSRIDKIEINASYYWLSEYDVIGNIILYDKNKETMKASNLTLEILPENDIRFKYLKEVKIPYKNIIIEEGLFNTTAREEIKYKDGYEFRYYVGNNTIEKTYKLIVKALDNEEWLSNSFDLEVKKMGILDKSLDDISLTVKSFINKLRAIFNENSTLIIISTVIGLILIIFLIIFLLSARRVKRFINS